MPSAGEEQRVSRIGWVDRARGLAILPVVLGHVLGGLIDSPLGQGSQAMRTGFFTIYTFHMPLFFLLAGLMVGRRVAAGSGSFVGKLLPGIVWPYFLWSVVQLVAIWAAGALVNRPVESIWPGVSGLLWQPVSQFWFLYALFWLHILAVLALPRIGREGLLLLALALKALMLVVDLPFAARLVCSQALFYAIGVWLAPEGVERLAKSGRSALKVALLVFAAGLLIFLTYEAAGRYAPDIPLLAASSPQIANVAWRFPAVAAALAGTFAVTALAMALSGRAGVWIARLGRQTMPVYLLHILFIAGGRILFTRLGMGQDELALLVALLFALGLAGPLAVSELARRAGIDRYLGFR